MKCEKCGKEEIEEIWGYEAFHNTDCQLCGGNGCDICHEADAANCDECREAMCFCDMDVYSSGERMKCKKHKWITETRISKQIRHCAICNKTQCRRLQCSNLGASNWL